MTDSKVHNVLIGCTGSVATIKLPNIVQGLRNKFGDQANIRIILTKNSKFFLPEDLTQVTFI